MNPRYRSRRIMPSIGEHTWRTVRCEVVATSQRREEKKDGPERGQREARNFCRRTYPRVVEGRPGPLGGKRYKTPRHWANRATAAMHNYVSRPVGERAIGMTPVRSRSSSHSLASFSARRVAFSRLSRSRKIQEKIFLPSSSTNPECLPFDREDARERVPRVPETSTRASRKRNARARLRLQGTIESLLSIFI